MSEQELTAALQALAARQPSSLEPRSLSAELISRDRWRVRLLAGLTALLWLGGIAGVLYMVYWFNQFIIAYTPVPSRDPQSMEAALAANAFHSKMELHHSLEACMAAVPALLLAALGTVWLVFSSRRATLNQINLSLLEIAEQLRQMRHSTRSPEGG
jgi:hypothetical protein